jgi:hypothetical protein
VFLARHLPRDRRRVKSSRYRVGWAAVNFALVAAIARGLFASVNSAGAAGLTGLTLVLGSVGVDSQDIQVYCRT